jgi:hypothetical protein
LLQKEKNAIDFWVIAKLPNQSDLGDRSNWRWVSLLSIASNVIAIILVHRISIEYVETLNGVQPSGIKGKSFTEEYFCCMDMIPVLVTEFEEIYIEFILKLLNLYISRE